MGEIHELFVLPLFLVWFAGATPDKGAHSWCVYMRRIHEDVDIQ